MAIRVSYTPVQALGELAKQAGYAQAAREHAERTHQMALQQQQMAHQRRMLELQQQFQTERDNFRAFLGLEAEKRAQAWELEKMETNSRLQYETQSRLSQMATEAQFQQELNNLLVERQRINQRRQALQDALDEGRISQKDFERYAVQLDIGTSPNVIAQIIAAENRSGDSDLEMLQQFLDQRAKTSPAVPAPISRERTLGGVQKPIQLPTGVPEAVRLGSESLQLANQMAASQQITDEEYQEITSGLATGKPDVIKKIRDRLEEIRIQLTRPKVPISDMMTPWGS